MKKIVWINENICQYVFEGDQSKPNIELNITVLINKNNALIIDTAYEQNALAVKADLTDKGIQVDEVVLSHYHPDHAHGAGVFKSAKLSGSTHYEENFINCNDVWDKEHDYRRPERLVKSEDTMIYGPFKLRFIEAPGHSKCSLIIIINERYAHVGDLIMIDSDNKTMLPFMAKDGNLVHHINSLTSIKELVLEKLILSHGQFLEGKREIDQAIDSRLHYLNALLEYKSEGDINMLIGETPDSWTCLEWHKYNLKNTNMNL